MGARLVNKFLYPAPNPPHYECDSFPNHIIWIPRKDEKGCIPSLMIRCPGAKNLIIYAHGNGCDIGDMKMELDYFSHTLQAHICAFELRGYGSASIAQLITWRETIRRPKIAFLPGCDHRSSNADRFNPGLPSEKDICSDIMDVYEYFTKKNPDGKFPTQNIMLWGRSIGSGPTTWLASTLAEQKTDIAGLILQSPFTSIKGAAQHIAGAVLVLLPIFTLFADLPRITKKAALFFLLLFTATLQLDRVRVPIQQMERGVTDRCMCKRNTSGKKDTLIPHSHGEALHKACGSMNKRLHLSETADHNRFEFTGDIIKVLPVTQFVDELCSNSFDWGERVSAKCPSSLYKIPEYAKKMHAKARQVVESFVYHDGIVENASVRTCCI
eukprot:jgi/Bigna1/68440/fgenesh1_pg.6_\